jgi:hypothetical protein
MGTLYHIYMSYCTLILAALPLLTALTTTNHALAWDGDGWIDHGWFNQCCGYWNEGSSCCSDQRSCCGGGGTDAYKAGISDAVYDHQNGLSYNPIGNCLSCHSPDYWNNFRQGYEHQWNTYQNTHQTVNNYVTINGNGNDVNINNRQNSDQSSLNEQQPQSEGCCGWNNR